MAAGKAAGLTGALLDRLQLSDARIDGMIKGIRAVVALKDPVGQKISKWLRPNGLEILKVRVPIGVIAIIYEARPNVTADAAVLCIKTSNAVILRGGKEAHALQPGRGRCAAGRAARRRACPRTPCNWSARPTATPSANWCRLEGRVDLAIPRGGEGLIRAVTEHARVPVIKHYKGVCYVYVHASADRAMALRIIENAKCQRPGVCNAIEHVVVDQAIAKDFLPVLAKALRARKVELRGDEAARAVVADLKAATEQDWSTEYLDLILT
jgi:glutamate-5-semialdehyde dehydrogenase